MQFAFREYTVMSYILFSKPTECASKYLHIERTEAGTKLSWYSNLIVSLVLIEPWSLFVVEAFSNIEISLSNVYFLVFLSYLGPKQISFYLKNDSRYTYTSIYKSYICNNLDLAMTVVWDRGIYKTWSFNKSPTLGKSAAIQ